jgi:hypothetical protein
MEQTAVEWLQKKLWQNNILTSEELELFEQANEMFEQQIIDACYFGSQNLPYEVKDKSEQYYNEQFKNK